MHKIIRLSLMLVVLSLVMLIPYSPVVADGPEKANPVPLDAVTLAEEMAKQLNNPVYPQNKPPLENDIQKNQSVLLSEDWYHSCYDPYKDGTNAIGISRTRSLYQTGDPRYVYAYAWLWKWDGSQWVQVTSGSSWGYCGGLIYNCEVYATAFKSSAVTGYYITTSRHMIDSVDSGRIYFQEDESNAVNLTY